MKKRHLRPEIEVALTAVAAMLFFPIVMIDRIDLSFIPIYLGVIAFEVVIILLLAKYGRGICLDGKH